MDYKVLDASAFYAGIPFGSPETYHTAPPVFDEISHIKRNHGALETLIQTGRLIIMEPDHEHVCRIGEAAGRSGDAGSLSEGDISVLALCLQLGGELVTDDFAVSNVASMLGIRAIPIMTFGIRSAGRWVYYCAGCGVQFARRTECPRCGNPLRRKLSNRRAPS